VADLSSQSRSLEIHCGVELTQVTWWRSHRPDRLRQQGRSIERLFNDLFFQIFALRAKSGRIKKECTATQNS
jgi:hypothetical protein